MIVDERVQNLLNKVKALADKGIGGESDNAKEILEHLMIKYDITVEDLNDVKLRQVELRYSNPYEDYLSTQVMFKVLDGTGRVPYYYVHRRYKRIYADMTASEEIEVRYLYSLYREKLHEDLMMLTKGFVLKNQIYSTSVEGKDASDLDFEEIMKLRRMRDSASFVEVHKALESGDEE